MKYHCFALGCHDETDYPELFYQCYFCGHWFCQHHAEIHFKGLARKELRRGIKELKQKQADEASQRSVTNVLLKIENEKLIAKVERLREYEQQAENYFEMYRLWLAQAAYQRRHRKWALEKARNTLFCERYEIEEWREALKEAEAEVKRLRELLAHEQKQADEASQRSVTNLKRAEKAEALLAERDAELEEYAEAFEQTQHQGLEWRGRAIQAEAELADCREQARLREADVWQLEARAKELEQQYNSAMRAIKEVGIEGGQG
jgi:DNA repair exonuclease SbcCD ATPase subunit